MPVTPEPPPGARTSPGAGPDLPHPLQGNDKGNDRRSPIDSRSPSKPSFRPTTTPGVARTPCKSGVFLEPMLSETDHGSAASKPLRNGLGTRRQPQQISDAKSPEMRDKTSVLG